MHVRYRYIIFMCLHICTLFSSISAQETNSSVRAIVRSERNELLAGANVRAVHEPTQNSYNTTIRKDGFFYFSNLRPGGPYTVIISYTGYEVLKKTELYLNFNFSGNFVDVQYGLPVEFVLKESIKYLKEVVVVGSRFSNLNVGTTTNINATLLASMPTISRNLQDFIRLVPQSKVNGDGMISLAGQNSKFNAFFIDGANNNDLLGLAVSGISGGQSGTPPISIDALEDITVLLAPYDVQYSHFTGGSINAITKSGNNNLKTEAWYYFRNEKMAGRSPVPVEVNGNPGVFERPRLADFFNQTVGFSLRGPLIRDKLFYFVLAERQLDIRPQFFDFSTYRGNSSLNKLHALSDTLRIKYNYDAGSFQEFKEQVNAIRTLFKIDWYPSDKNKLMFSYRYNDGDRITPNSPFSSTLIRFSNNGFNLKVKNHTASLEWKNFGRKNGDNRFLFSMIHQIDDRSHLGKAFPSVSIRDGSGRIFFGSNASAQENIFKGTDLSILDVFTFFIGKHHVTSGIELKLSNINDLFVSNYFGGYQFNRLDTFLTGKYPTRYQHSFPLSDNVSGNEMDQGASFKTLRQGYFINDEFQVSEKLRMNFGIRLDANTFLTDPREDSFFNDTAAVIISQYYDLEGAKTGKKLKTIWQVSPRFGFTYAMPKQNMVIRGGAGLFTGHILNLWMSNIFASVYGRIDIDPSLYSVGFNPDPNNQPDFQALGLDQENEKGELTLLSDRYKFPSVFRTSLSIEKRAFGNWIFSIEALFNKNIYETQYANVNLIPPVLKSSPPDSRNIYSLKRFPDFIPLSANGGNPYSSIILQSNNKGKKGYAYSFSGMISKSLYKKTTIQASYTFARSASLFEPTGTANGVIGQWSSLETVNGKNFSGISNSDFGYGHRISILLEKYFTYSKGKGSTNISFFFNGMSGSPYSYVYQGSIVNDNGNLENYDLIYIPTQQELTKMIFVPNTINGVTSSGEQQKLLYEQFIQDDKYLQKHRGQFAERNGARLPFSGTVDLQIQQIFNIKAGKSNIRFRIVYSIFNFANMLNKDWGRMYFMSFDNYPILKIAGLSNTPNPTPQYQFTPVNGELYSIQPGSAPGNSARWISQLGFKFELE